jgi:hypothetical protein
LSSVSDLRLPPPPGEADTRAELAELQNLANNRDAAALDRIRYWDAGAPPYRWTQRTIKYAQAHGVAANRAFRLLALLNVAISDATVAAYDTKQAYSRPRPSSSLAAISMPANPAYPDEHAVAAGAASSVLSYVFPADAEVFASWANEAARSRLEAGVAYPSDIEAGLTLGRQVGERAIAWGKADGSDAIWSGTVPTEPGMWTGANPYEPLAGTWKPWALASNDQFRPGPPPAPDSEVMAQELADVKTFSRTNLTNLKASYWEYHGGRALFEYWNDLASRLIFEHRLQDDALQAARVYALVNIASHDAGCGMLGRQVHLLGAAPDHARPNDHHCVRDTGSSQLPVRPLVHLDRDRHRPDAAIPNRVGLPGRPRRRDR